MFHWVSHHCLSSGIAVPRIDMWGNLYLAVAMGFCQILKSEGPVLGAFQFQTGVPIYNSRVREASWICGQHHGLKKKINFPPFPFSRCFITLKYESLCPLILWWLSAGFRLWFLRWKGQRVIHSAAHRWRLTESSSGHVDDDARLRVPEGGVFLFVPGSPSSAIARAHPVCQEWGRRVFLGSVLTAANPWP